MILVLRLLGSFGGRWSDDNKGKDSSEDAFEENFEVNNYNTAIYFVSFLLQK